MNLSDMHSWLENNSYLEGTHGYVEKEEWSQSKCRSMIGKIREGGSSILYSGMPSSHYIRQSQHHDIAFEGHSGPGTYLHSLNSGNVISSSFAVHQEISGGETENNSTELNPSVLCKDWNLRKQEVPPGLNRDKGNNLLLDNSDFVVGKASSFTPRDKKGKGKPRKAEMDANITAGMRAHIGFRVTRTERHLNPSLVSRPSGSKDRHTMVLTKKGPRDRRMRLSVGTAIKLYCVQDMLGFEQPSQAVEWLIEKSQAAILELPQVDSISSSRVPQDVDSSRTNASLSPLQTGEFSTLSEENTFTTNGDFAVNLYQQILGAKTWNDQKSSTATTTASSNNGSIIKEGTREHKSLALSSIASKRRTRETANLVPRKLFRAKARERARERTKQKEKHYNLESGICGILQSSSVRPEPSSYCLQNNTTSVSCLNMMNETTDGHSNSDAFLHDLVFPKDSMLDTQSGPWRNSPLAEIQCSSLASTHYYNPQQEGGSVQSTGAFSSIDPGAFHLLSCQFLEDGSTPSTSCSQGVFCTYALEHANLESCNLCRCCTDHSIEMPCSYDDALESLYERRYCPDKGSFLEFK